jgi:hypothetical protein
MSEYFLQRGVVHHQLSQQVLQLSVLVFEADACRCEEKDRESIQVLQRGTPTSGNREQSPDGFSESS